MKAVGRRRPNEAHIVSSAVGIVLMLTLSSHAKANPTTQLLLSRDASRGGAEEYKGVVELTVDPPFDGANVSISVDGERITDALVSPYRATVDFGPRTVEHRLTVTAWTVDHKKRVQWSETVNRGHKQLTVKLRAIDAPKGAFQALATAPDDDPITAIQLWDSGQVIATASTPPYRFDVSADHLLSGFLQATARTRSGNEAADFWSNAGDVHVENVDVRTVPLYVSVVDHNGQARDDVDKSLFLIMDGNSEGKIIEFGKAFDQPISIALLLDASASMTYSMDDATRAALGFVERTLKTGDRCAVFAIHDVPRRVQELTTDKALIRKALTGMKASGDTALFDAVNSAVRELKNEKARRAIVVLTDGGDNSSLSSWDDIEKTAREAGIPIYFVAYESLEPTAEEDLDHMKFLASETGGFVAAGTQQTLTAKYGEIEKDLRAQFAIIYQIADFSKHNEWRKVRVLLKSSRLTARTIGGYFAP
jgi:Ca-activated chloride channel family protein